MIELYPESLVEPSNIEGGGYLPMFYVLNCYDDNAVKMLVQVFPKCLQTYTDPNRRLPLHIACKLKHGNIIPFLLQQDPQAAQVKDKHSMLPLHYAVDGPDTVTTKVIEKLLLAWPDAHFVRHHLIIQVITELFWWKSERMTAMRIQMMIPKIIIQKIHNMSGEVHTESSEDTYLIILKSK